MVPGAFSFPPPREYLPAAVDTLERLREYVMSRFAREGSPSIGPDDDLLKQGFLDSIAIMEIVGFIEQAFGFPVEGDEVTVDNFQSLASMTRLVERKLEASRGQHGE
jgi:acyl carrier protein